MKKTLIALLSCICIVSCSDDYAEKTTEFNAKSGNPPKNVAFKKGVLIFKNKQILKSVIDEFSQYSSAEQRNYFLSFYSDGFHPLYLNSDEKFDNALIKTFVQRKDARVKKVYEFSPAYAAELNSFDDDLIADESFASFLNDEREIIVGDSLYKYTYNGIYRAKAADSLTLNQYVDQNHLAYTVAVAANLIPGINEVTPGVEEIILTPTQNMLDCNPTGIYPGQMGFVNLTAVLPDCPPPSYPSGGFGGTSSVDTQIEWMNSLQPCSIMNGFFGSDFAIFGVVKKCHDYFNDDRRTKTKYWKENYFVYNSIGVKVKHQKYKDVFLGAGWWYASETDEVVLSISQASFTYDMPVNFPPHYNAPTLYYFNDKVYNNQGLYLAAATDYNSNDPFPELPFDSEVIITEFINDQTGLALTGEQLREKFYNGVWSVANNIVKGQMQRSPKNVTHILYTPSRIYLNYVDLEKRVENEKKIVHTLDYNWGVGFKFSAYVSGDGSISTNWGNFAGNPAGFISIPKLYNYDNVQMDFVGATRHGGEWKGSRIVYTD